MTWGELMLLFPFFSIMIYGILTTFYEPSLSGSGHASRLPLSLCFLTSNHNSLLTLLIGIPFDRAIKYHKISGYLAFLNGVGHTYVAYIEAISTNRGTDVAGNSEGLHEVNGFFFNWSTGSQTNLSGSFLLVTVFLMLMTSHAKLRLRV